MTNVCRYALQLLVEVRYTWTFVYKRNCFCLSFVAFYIPTESVRTKHHQPCLITGFIARVHFAVQCVTNSMKQEHFSEADSRSAGQKFACLL